MNNGFETFYFSDSSGKLTKDGKLVKGSRNRARAGKGKKSKEAGGIAEILGLNSAQKSSASPGRFIEKKKTKKKKIPFSTTCRNTPVYRHKDLGLHW